MTAVHPSAPARQLSRWMARVHTRLLLAAAATILPIGLACAVLTRDAPLTAFVVGLLGAAVVLVFTAIDLRRHNRAWLCRRLDADLPQLEDSSSLLLRSPETLSPLARLQRTRIATRLSALAELPVRPGLPWRRVVISTLVSTAIAAAGLLNQPGAAPPIATVIDTLAATPVRITTRVVITPPAYTRSAARSLVDNLDLRVEQGARVSWAVQLANSPDPESIRLVFVDGSTLPLRAEDDAWRGERSIDRATLYRLEIDGAPVAGDPDLHRIDVIADQPPEPQLLSPAQTMNLHQPGDRRWHLRWRASDDYGLADSTLQLTLAAGDGENVQFREFQHRFSAGGARERQWDYTVDLDALGFSAGSDLIARIRVRDTRSPKANDSRLPSVILRWPPESSQAGEAMEGIVQNTLPAYFRSQRQIVIDIEQLISERPGLKHETLVDRSDAIGVDQRILRLRYGQFLGEETEVTEGPDGGHGHDEDGPESPPAGFGDRAGVVAEFGHSHDHAEATTLFDPATRALLKSAIDAMWRAEEQLRLGEPEAAHPHALRALDRIKQVQQATRIYLARVGLELPPIDFSRRLGGKRDGLGPTRDPLATVEPVPDPLGDLWRLLDTRDVAAAIESGQAWLSRADIDDSLRLPLAAALDTLARQPDCADCRTQVRAALWPLLPNATPVPAPRPSDANGEGWLDALSTEATP